MERQTKQFKYKELREALIDNIIYYPYVSIKHKKRDLMDLLKLIKQEKK